MSNNPVGTTLADMQAGMGAWKSGGIEILMAREAEERRKQAMISDWLNSDPNLAYQARLGQLRPGLSDFFGSQLGTYYNRYQGELANEARVSSELPTRTFSSFLNPINFEQEYAGLSPYRRGFNLSRSAPSARWLNW